MSVCEKSAVPRANSKVEWKYLSDCLPCCFCLEMAELTGISGLRCFCSDLSQALGCLGVLLPVLLFPAMAHGQLQWKCEGKREKRLFREHINYRSHQGHGQGAFLLFS